MKAFYNTTPLYMVAGQLLAAAYAAGHVPSDKIAEWRRWAAEQALLLWEDVDETTPRDREQSECRMGSIG